MRESDRARKWKRGETKKERVKKRREAKRKERRKQRRKARMTDRMREKVNKAVYLRVSLCERVRKGERRRVYKRIKCQAMLAPVQTSLKSTFILP
jgi:hypothetical protein